MHGLLPSLRTGFIRQYGGHGTTEVEIVRTHIGGQTQSDN